MTRRADILDTMTDRQILNMAARHLDILAEDVRSSHTLSDGRWCIEDEIDSRAKMEYDLARAIARRLRRIAKAR